MSAARPAIEIFFSSANERLNFQEVSASELGAVFLQTPQVKQYEVLRWLPVHSSSKAKDVFL